MRRKFDLGQIVITPGALDAFDETGQDWAVFAVRHVTGDWGDLDEEDKRANEDALTLGNRLLSVYHLSDGTKIYIITECDRSYSTILLPSEY